MCRLHVLYIIACQMIKLNQQSMKLMGLFLVLSVSRGDLTLKLDFLGRSPPPPPDAEDEEEGRLVREVDVVSPLMTFSDCVR